MNPVETRGKSAGVRAKPLSSQQRGFQPPLNPAHPPLSMYISSLFPVDPLDFMALKAHLNVPGVRLPARKERKTRLKLLDNDDEDYRKGERVAPDFPKI